MSRLWIPVLMVLLASGARAGVFPYPIQKKTLPNKLDVLVVETPEFKDVLSVNTLVMAGARNELEKGKSGLAHLFEHILFRHRYGGEDNGYNKGISMLGAHNNAWTWFDVTFYHPLTFAVNLSGILKLEADRFRSLDFTEKTFKTESGAVLGEYRNNASYPTLKMSETLLATMFPHHPYGHTTLGFYEDVLDMPNEYRAALKFYKEYYRPNNCVLIVTGDVKAEEVFREAQRAYAGWEPGPIPEVTTTGPAPEGPQRKDVGWDADVAPLVWVAYRMPAFKPDTKDGAIAEILKELLVSPAAPLFKQVRYDKKTVSDLHFADGTAGFESSDSRAMTLSAQLYKDKFSKEGAEYVDDVAADLAAGVEALQRYSRVRGAGERLDKLKSKYRYDFLAALSSPAKIAGNIAHYYRFGRDADVFEKMFKAVESLKPEDIDDFARRHFTAKGRFTVALTHQKEEKK